MKVIKFAKSTDIDLKVTLTDDQNDPVTGYTSSDTPTAALWAGDDRAVLATGTCSWIDPTAGTVLLTFAASDTSSLDPGRYLCRVLINTEDDRRVQGVRFWVDLEDEPGTAEAPTTYGSYEDMLLYAPWIEQLQAETDQAGFAEARHEARTWLEAVIQAHYQTTSSATSLSFPGNSWGWVGGSRGRDEILQGYLDDDKLIVTEQVRQIVAKRALGNILRSALGPAEKEFSQYQRLASQLLNEAEELAAGYVALIDTDDDGTPDIRINCGVISHRLI